MGITDEDYARAIQEQQLQHMKAHIEYLNKQREKEMAATGLGSGMVIVNQGGQTTTFTNNGNYPASIGLKVITEENLHHDAMKAPLSALVDMWTVRWQGEWVNEAEFDEDDFWRLALIRLMGANKLEKHNLANQYRSVYRIIE